MKRPHTTQIRYCTPTRESIAPKRPRRQRQQRRYRMRPPRCIPQGNIWVSCSNKSSMCSCGSGSFVISSWVRVPVGAPPQELGGLQELELQREEHDSKCKRMSSGDTPDNGRRSRLDEEVQLEDIQQRAEIYFAAKQNLFYDNQRLADSSKYSRAIARNQHKREKINSMGHSWVVMEKWRRAGARALAAEDKRLGRVAITIPRDVEIEHAQPRHTPIRSGSHLKYASYRTRRYRGHVLVHHHEDNLHS